MISSESASASGLLPPSMSGSTMPNSAARKESAIGQGNVVSEADCPTIQSSTQVRNRVSWPGVLQTTSEGNFRRRHACTCKPVPGVISKTELAGHAGGTVHDPKVIAKAIEELAK
jgi:hypothetical protein